jgi:excisionase family DNA binding protein
LVKSPVEDAKWLSLGEACRVLEVNEATLRQWADNGYLRIYRTPGGHRRFWSGDVMALTAAPAAGAHNGVTGDVTMEGPALRRIRRRLHHGKVARQPWFQSIEEEGRDRMRLFGRRLLSLLAQEPLRRRKRPGAFAESTSLGREYGTAMADRGVPLADTLEAFVFFRSMVLESADSQHWGRILELADRVLVGVAESYQNRSDSRSENRNEVQRA